MHMPPPVGVALVVLYYIHTRDTRLGALRCLVTEVAGIVDGCYLYTADLVALEEIGPQPPTSAHPISGFLLEVAWDQYLHSHPDKVFAGYLRRGIRYGFRVGFTPNSTLNRTLKNHQSVTDSPEVVHTYIQQEVENNKLWYNSKTTPAWEIPPDRGPLSPERAISQRQDSIRTLLAALRVSSYAGEVVW